MERERMGIKKIAQNNKTPVCDYSQAGATIKKF